MPGQPHSGKAPSWRRTWLLPLLIIAGRRVGLYIVLYVVHCVLAGLVLAGIATKAGAGSTDALFWLSYGWVALQFIASPKLFVPTSLALAFVALQATSGDRDVIFWVCFAWLALGMLRGGLLMLVTRSLGRRAREQAQAEAGPGFESIFTRFAGGGFTWSDEPGASSSGSAGPPGSADYYGGRDTIEGTAREIHTELVDKLERLAALHKSGAITAEEYEAAKRALLDSD